MDDEALMLRVAEDDLSYASLLFERYNVPIYNYFLKNTFNKMVSQDLTQNVFLRLIKYRNTFRGDYQFRPWIYRIARNVFYDHTKENKKNYSYNIDERQIDDLFDENYLDKSEKIENEKLLYKALNKMKQEDRELLNLSKFQEIKYKEIAEMMDLTESAIKVKVHRAIKKLREIYYNIENE